MVWIHGGGFVVGSGSEPRYDGTPPRRARHRRRDAEPPPQCARLSRASRADAAESEHGASGNYGMLDLVAALQWVNRNIEAFGGDPDRVTIAGESAGSEAVSALMASPLAKGLFARAIGESGAMFATPSRSPAPLAAAEAQGLAFMRRVGAGNLAELRAAPAEAILAAAPGLGYRPIVDGHFLPKSPAADLRRRRTVGRPADGRLEQGRGLQLQRAEGRGRKRTYAEIVRDIFGERAQDALAFYPAESTEEDAASARRAGRRHGDRACDLVMARGPEDDGRGRLFRFRFDRAPLDAGRLVRRAFQRRSGRVSRRRTALCLRQSPRVSVAITDDDRGMANSPRATGSTSSRPAIPTARDCLFGRRFARDAS